MNLKSWRLATREQAVVEQVAKGLCNKDIARVLGLSVNTVKLYMQHIFQKTNISNRTELAIWWLKYGKDEYVAEKEMGTNRQANNVPERPREPAD